MNDAMISVQALTKTYGFGARKVEAVRGVDFEVGRGEIFGLVSPDGAGSRGCINMRIEEAKWLFLWVRPLHDPNVHTRQAMEQE